MEITCEHCEVTLNIPDEKIPEGQVVRISCPKCKSKISIDTGKRRVRQPPTVAMRALRTYTKPRHARSKMWSSIRNAD